MTKVIEYIKYDHIWFIQYSKYILKFVALLKALKFKNANSTFHYFYFLSKDHQLAYLTCLCPQEYEDLKVNVLNVMCETLGLKFQELVKWWELVQDMF
jgi:hypothetical protein